MEKVWQLEWVG